MFHEVFSAKRQLEKTDNGDNIDQIALSQHNTVFHGTINEPSIYHFYAITFVEQFSFHSLNICEDEWLNKVTHKVI